MIANWQYETAELFEKYWQGDETAELFEKYWQGDETAMLFNIAHGIGVKDAD